LCLLFRIACFDMLDGFFDSINSMSRSVKNDYVTSEHVIFFFLKTGNVLIK
jgi:hypothetical protein